MNRFFRKIVFLLPVIALLFVTSTNAQVAVRAIGFTGGAYSPSMDYYNDAAFNTWNESFGSSLFGNAFVEINIVKILSARIGAGYWNQEIASGGITFGDETRTDKMSVQLLPITLDMIVRTPDEMMGDFGIYGGLGAGTVMIDMKYTTSIPSIGTSEEEHSGRDFIAHLILGADYKVMKNFAIGGEFRYVFGNYDQEVIVESTTTSYKNSIDGVQFMGTLKYLF